ncbi:MAG: DUF4191 domain-containing protein [Actinomycetales bacterium]|nr:DUF4191 domain-containing protein [Actinomycetales bacterium]
MAKQDQNKAPKKQGQVRQLLSMYKMTMAADKKALWWALLPFGLSLLLGIALANLLSPNNGLGQATWIVTGVLLGFLGFLITMSRRAERVAYQNIEGKQGAVGAVLSSALKRGWRTSERPVAVNPRTFDAVYRAIGPAGVVLIAEGKRSQVRQLLEDEKKRIARVASGVPIHVFWVVDDAEGTPLLKLARSIYKLKRTLNRSEITAVANRLSTVGMNLAVPKGIDPTKFRAPRR